jgi:hypothetical protein
MIVHPNSPPRNFGATEHRFPHQTFSRAFERETDFWRTPAEPSFVESLVRFELTLRCVDAYLPRSAVETLLVFLLGTVAYE